MAVGKRLYARKRFFNLAPALLVGCIAKKLLAILMLTHKKEDTISFSAYCVFLVLGDYFFRAFFRMSLSGCLKKLCIGFSERPFRVLSVPSLSKHTRHRSSEMI